MGARVLATALLQIWPGVLCYAGLVSDGNRRLLPGLQGVGLASEVQDTGLASVGMGAFCLRFEVRYGNEGRSLVLVMLRVCVQGGWKTYLGFRILSWSLVE